MGQLKVLGDYELERKMNCSPSPKNSNDNGECGMCDGITRNSKLESWEICIQKYLRCKEILWLARLFEEGEKKIMLNACQAEKRSFIRIYTYIYIYFYFSKKKREHTHTHMTIEGESGILLNTQGKLLLTQICGHKSQPALRGSGVDVAMKG